MALSLVKHFKVQKETTTYLLWSEAKGFWVLSMEKIKSEHPPQNSQQSKGQETRMAEAASLWLWTKKEMHLMY